MHSITDRKSKLELKVIMNLLLLSGAVDESVERMPHMREIESLVTSRVFPMTLQINMCRCIAWSSAIIRIGQELVGSVSG